MRRKSEGQVRRKRSQQVRRSKVSMDCQNSRL